ncbi:hypothetical protein [Luedemannella helvata]|uniref:GH18 domain-containing protein n=1 Tax=Luedemannella helvata TaxID=349315 RepID=A0ABP4X6A4_9ACTN
MRAQQLVFKVAAVAILAAAGAGAGMALGDLTDAGQPAIVVAPSPMEPPVPRPAPAPASAFRAPLYYQPLGSDVDLVGRALDASGARDLILAFVLDAGGCRPAWQGDPARPVGADAAVTATIDSVRRRGGDVAVSFGGAAGTELGAGCASERALADAYQKVVEAYDLTRIDLDYEVDDLAVGIGRRMRAVRLLLDRARAAHRPLRISLTLPVARTGLPPEAVGALKAALDAGVRPDIVNLMAFNLGAGTTTADIRGAVEAASGQVKGLTGGTDADVYARLGLQLMIGHADLRGEELSPAQARSLVDYARSRRLGWVSFWSLNRDRACPTPALAQWAVATCSGVAQRPYEFASIVAGYAG